MDAFQDLNGNTVYLKVNSRAEAVAFKEKAKEKTLEGKSVALVFDNRYHLYLAPGHDPYQIRREVDAFVNPPSEDSGSGDQAETDAANNTAEKPAGKKPAPSKPSSSESGKALKKKGFWNSFK